MFFSKRKAEATAPVAPEVVETGQTPEEKSVEARRRLNDRSFLEFFQKDPVSVEQSYDDDFVLEKARVYDSLKKIKGVVKKFIVGESSSGFSNVIEGQFMDQLEDIAISEPEEYEMFANSVNLYVDSANENAELMATYERVGRALGFEDDFSNLSIEGKKRYAEALDEVIAELIGQNKKALKEGRAVLGERGVSTFIPFLGARKKWKEDMGKIESDIAGLQLNREGLRKEQMLNALDEMSGLLDSMKSNFAFEVLRSAFITKANQRIQEAIAAGNNTGLSRDLATMERLQRTGALDIDDSDFDYFEGEISTYTRGNIREKTENIVGSDEAVTLNVYEKGIEKMREEGFRLGLTQEECDAEIIDVLYAKTAELKAHPDEGQNKIKLILVRRVLISSLGQ